MSKTLEEVDLNLGHMTVLPIGLLVDLNKHDSGS